jgi:hypothetical protein
MPPQSTFAIKRYPTGAPTLICPSCGDTMKHLHTIAKLGVRPEHIVFVCPSCKGIEAKEVKRLA